MARSINDGAKPLVPMQVACPVCGNAIKPDVHTQAKEDRVYFDSQECLNEWKNNTEKYRQKLLQEQGFPGGQ